ncbi:MAG: hypothetical protein JWM19_5073 [Actinomycetia bacterium]|nr:hypothetical protein [Actinomycetes bacterium]
MTGPWRRRDQRREFLSEIQRGLQPVAPPSILVLLWRWRWEVTIFLGLPAGMAHLGHGIGLPRALAAAGLAVAPLAWPQARRWLIDHLRCIVIAHRVRTGCAQAWIQTRSGKLPVLLLTTPRPYGERVYVWCRAGISGADFAAGRDILRSACWARDVRVSSYARYSHIVVLDIIRV